MSVRQNLRLASQLRLQVVAKVVQFESKSFPDYLNRFRIVVFRQFAVPWPDVSIEFWNSIRLKRKIDFLANCFRIGQQRFVTNKKIDADISVDEVFIAVNKPPGPCDPIAESFYLVDFAFGSNSVRKNQLGSLPARVVVDQPFVEVKCGHKLVVRIPNYAKLEIVIPCLAI